MPIESCARPTIDEEKLDFRAELIGNHYQEFLENGASKEESREQATIIAHIELTKMFLERYLKEHLVHYSYYLQDGKMHSPGYEGLGDVTNRYLKAVVKKDVNGQDSSREKAEFEGVFKLKQKALEATGPFSTLIISGPPDEGYNFYYFGQHDPQSGKINMWAWMNEKDKETQIREANTILKEEHFSAQTHTNDLLANPIFTEGQELDRFRNSVEDFPTDEQMEVARQNDMAKYAPEILKHSKMLVALIESSASIPTLRSAQKRIEMDYTRWVKGEEIRATDSLVDYALTENHQQFRVEVEKELQDFVRRGYENEMFACGMCGNSVLSPNYRSTLQAKAYSQVYLSVPELAFVKCSCGNTVSIGSGSCSECGRTQEDYEREKTSSIA